MTATSLRRNVADDLVRRVLAQLGDRIHSIVLFGSVARDEANSESDVDLLIITDDTLSTRNQIYDICYDLEESHDFEFLVQPLRFTIDWFEAEVRMRSWLAFAQSSSAKARKRASYKKKTCYPHSWKKCPRPKPL